MAVPDYRAREADDRWSGAPTLPQPPLRERLEQEHEGEHRRRPLMVVIASLLVLIEVAWVVALSAFTYWAVT